MSGKKKEGGSGWWGRWVIREKPGAARAPGYWSQTLSHSNSSSSCKTQGSPPCPWAVLPQPRTLWGPLPCSAFHEFKALGLAERRANPILKKKIILYEGVRQSFLLRTEVTEFSHKGPETISCALKEGVYVHLTAGISLGDFKIPSHI